MKYIDEYKISKPLYKEYCERIVSLLKSILNSAQIDYHLIEGRAKSVESLLEKFKRKRYTDPSNQITDLAGIRIIVYYQKDIFKVEKLLKSNFVIDKENSSDKSADLKSNEFGYLSNHYVVSLNDQRNSLPEWKSFGDFIAEIQLRTVLQHAWASISHELQYKSKYDVPDTLKRRLFRLAGLFELADEEFGAVKLKQSELNDAISNRRKIENKKVYEEVNLDTISKFFETEAAFLQRFRSSGEAAGFDLSHAFENEEDEHLHYSEIVRVLNKLSVKSITEFKNILKEVSSTVESLYSTIFELQPKKYNEERYWGATTAFLVKLALFSKLSDNDLDEYTNRGWSAEILDRVKRAINKWKKQLPKNAK